MALISTVTDEHGYRQIQYLMFIMFSDEWIRMHPWFTLLMFKSMMHTALYHLASEDLKGPPRCRINASQGW